MFFESSFLSFLVNAAVAFATLSAVVYGYLWNRAQYFKRKGIPGPPVESVFSGNLRALQHHRAPHTDNLQRWVKEYGDLFGYYEGSMRVLFTSRYDIIRDVFMNKFEKFHGRKPINPFPFNPDTDDRASVFISRGNRWKRLRGMFEPAFNQKMTRLYQNVFNDSNVQVCRFLDANLDKPLDFHVLTLEWVSDIMERLCVGKKHSSFGKGVSDVAKLVDLFFHPPSYWENKLMRMYVSTHEFTNFTQYIHKFLIKFFPNPLYKVEAAMAKIIAEKRRTRRAGDAPNDIIDLFVDYQASDEDIKELKRLNKMTTDQFKTQVHKQLTEAEILSMATMTVLAAVETTHTTLKEFFYSIAGNPKSQKKLRDEIDEYIVTREDINLETVGQMEYLDWCLKENQRLHPVAYPAISRECMETTTVGDDNFEIEKGVFLYANYYEMHRDPQYWGEDADEYDPERWNPMNNRLPANVHEVYAPFGQLSAPRTCPGRHFGTAEVKLAVCELLSKYYLTLDKEKTKENEHGILVYSLEKIFINVHKRIDRPSPSRKASRVNNNSTLSFPKFDAEIKFGRSNGYIEPSAA